MSTHKHWDGFLFLLYLQYKHDLLIYLFNADLYGINTYFVRESELCEEFACCLQKKLVEYKTDNRLPPEVCIRITMSLILFEQLWQSFMSSKCEYTRL